MMDFSKLKVAEIKQLISEQFDIPINQITATGKTNVVNMYKALCENVPQQEELTEQLELEQEVLNTNDYELELIDHEDTTIEFNKKIHRSDPGWSDYVLQHLAPDEIDNGFARADAFKRLVELLIGPIIEIDNIVIAYPTPDNGKIAVVTCRVTVQTENGPITYTGNADAVGSYINKAPYYQFLTAIAETRAEGRVFKKILGLKNVVSSEELIGTQDDHDTSSIEITSANIKYIDMMCNRETGYNLNVKELFHKLTGKLYNSINKYSAEDGEQVIKALRQLQSDDSKESRPEVNGYDSEWKVSFG